MTNSRLKNASDVAPVFIDFRTCARLAEDVEQTQVGKHGDPNEGPDRKRTRLSDAFAYLLCQRFGYRWSRRSGDSQFGRCSLIAAKRRT